MNKYIVKNCPSYDKSLMGCRDVSNKLINPCQDRTDCPIKQVVEMCKEVLDHAEWCNCTHYPTLIKILQFLQVQEVE